MTGVTHTGEAQRTMPLPPRPTSKVDIIAKSYFLAHLNVARGEAGDNTALDVGVGDIGVGHAGVVEAREKHVDAVMLRTTRVGKGE